MCVFEMCGGAGVFVFIIGGCVRGVRGGRTLRGAVRGVTGVFANFVRGCRPLYLEV